MKLWWALIENWQWVSGFDWFLITFTVSNNFLNVLKLNPTLIPTLHFFTQLNWVLMKIFQEIQFEMLSPTVSILCIKTQTIMYFPVTSLTSFRHCAFRNVKDSVTVISHVATTVCKPILCSQELFQTDCGITGTGGSQIMPPDWWSSALGLV